MTQVKGLNAILSSGAEFITFEEGKPLTLLFIDWYDDLIGIREHYEPSLNPKYIRCPGKDVCPLCHANPSKYPSFRVKFRVYDPADNKVKIVSLAKTHIQKLNTEFNLEEIDPRQNYVTIYRSGKTASDTSYSARAYRPNPAQNKPEIPLPDFNEIEIPDILPQVTPHTPEEIQGFMNAILATTSVADQPQQQFSYQFEPTSQGQFMNQPTDQAPYQQTPSNSSVYNQSVPQAGQSAPTVQDQFNQQAPAGQPMYNQQPLGNQNQFNQPTTGGRKLPF